MYQHVCFLSFLYLAASEHVKEKQTVRQTPGSQENVIRKAGTNPKDFLELHTKILKCPQDSTVRIYCTKTALSVMFLSVIKCNKPANIAISIGCVHYVYPLLPMNSNMPMHT